MWAFIHKLGSPKWFYGISAKLQPWFWAAAALLLLAWAGVAAMANAAPHTRLARRKKRSVVSKISVPLSAAELAAPPVPIPGVSSIRETRRDP